ncbi:hypothetical protein BJF93_00115 [Xaviernesmea oryzae]|uniref:Transcription regulator PadR N-terminal domain-containing protein n=1 Tax=Xaviernesmea oryzae TaxID=464029 RepID=A0A1Q9B0K8_9HYPH|nr:hypothetical protein BJF93_00115 [Xaviernesmea oryzae]
MDFGFFGGRGNHDRDGRHAEGRRHGRHEGRGGRGFGDDGGGRFARLLGQGDLRLLVLLMMEKEPCHGYEIIRQIETMTGGAYAPSPGVVYPTLTFLEEAGHANAEMDGNKKRFAITEDGKAYLDAHRERAEEILERLTAAGEHRERRHKPEARPQHGAPLPPGLDAAMLHLRDVVARKVAEDEKHAGTLMRVILQTAEELESDRRDA